jgi:hypothetical protein
MFRRNMSLSSGSKHNPSKIPAWSRQQEKGLFLLPISCQYHAWLTMWHIPEDRTLQIDEYSAHCCQISKFFVCIFYMTLMNTRWKIKLNDFLWAGCVNWRVDTLKGRNKRLAIFLDYLQPQTRLNCTLCLERDFQLNCEHSSWYEIK